MAVLVQKYGGTSVEGPDRIRAVARRVAAARAAGNDVLVVVSAMGRTTDELLRLAREVSPDPSRRELDMLLTAGERISMALLAMALGDLGVPAISFTGSQSGILTDAGHGAARIVAVRPERLRRELERGRVVIVAGFQGVNPETKEITTLGRGGSDTTAVALAATFGRARCETYTDVPGVFSADPRAVPAARVIPRLDYRVCSALAHLGGRVLHARCVDLAAREGVPLAVRSSFDESPGTEIGDFEMEGPRVEAVAHREDCWVAVAEGGAGGAAAQALIEAVADAFPELGLTAHRRDADARQALTWTGSGADAEALLRAFPGLAGAGWTLRLERDAAFVSVVGLGLGAGEAARAEAALERAGVAFLELRVSPAALVFRVPNGRAAEAVRALHAELVERTPPTP